MAFLSDDTYNLVEAHVLEAFLGDSKLGGLFQVLESDAGSNPISYVRVPPAGLLVKSTVNAGATSLVLQTSSTLVGWALAGLTFTFGTATVPYTVTARAQAAANQVTVGFSPSLSGTVAAGTTVTLASPTLALQTLSQEHREDGAEYMSHELPALSVELTGRTHELVALDDRNEDQFLGLVLIYLEEAPEGRQRQRIKQWAARVERCLAQQHYPNLQCNGLPTALEHGVLGSVEVTPTGTVLDGGPVPNTHITRGEAAISFALAVEMDTEEDP